ncbi:Hypothetical predicted protein, partial [Paramuricea clavata]
LASASPATGSACETWNNAAQASCIAKPSRKYMRKQELASARPATGSVRGTFNNAAQASRIAKPSQKYMRKQESTRAKLAAIRAKSAALEAKAVFLKRKQGRLRIAAEELELEQQVAEVRVKEQVYEKELNNCTNNMETTTPLTPNAEPFESSGLNVE